MPLADEIKRFGPVFIAGVVGIAGVAVAAFFWFSAPAAVENPPAKISSADRRPATSIPTPASPEDGFIPPRRHRQRLPDGGVETEADFFGEIRAWARSNPEAALVWAQQQPDGDDARKEALTDACFQIVQTDPERALTLAQRFNLNRDAVLANLAQQWAARDLPAASRWVADQPEGDSRNSLVRGVTLDWSRTDPAAAAQFVVGQMSPGAAYDATVTMVIHQWATTDPEGAAGWVRQYPAGPLHDQLTGELANVAASLKR